MDFKKLMLIGPWNCITLNHSESLWNLTTCSESYHISVKMMMTIRMMGCNSHTTRHYQVHMALLLDSTTAPTLFPPRCRVSYIPAFFHSFPTFYHDSRFAFCLSPISCSCHSWHGIQLVSRYTMIHPNACLLSPYHSTIQQTTTCNPSWCWYSEKGWKCSCKH